MNKGKVKFFNDAKGFGFITDSNDGKEYFVHNTGVVTPIREGDAAWFSPARRR